jgi:hypothetical protein
VFWQRLHFTAASLRFVQRLAAAGQFQIKPEIQSICGWLLFRFAADHGYRIVRALRRAIAATDAAFRINIYLSAGKTANGSGGTTGQTFRVLAMHANRRRKQALKTRLGFQLDRTFDVNTSPQ